MNIPNETLVLIIASGGAILVFFIAISIFCICRRTRRSRKAVIHILANPSQGLDDVDQPADQATWERNQLIPTARFLHTLNPKAKICAIGTSKSAWSLPVQSCILEHSSSSTNTSPASPAINHLPVNPDFTKTLCEEEKPGSSNHLRSTKSVESQHHNCNNEKLFCPESCSYQEDVILSQSVATNHSVVQHINKPLSTNECVLVPNVIDKLNPIHNVCSPELHPVEVNKKRQSFCRGSTSKETVKQGNVQPLQTKRLGKSSILRRDSQPTPSLNNCSNSHDSPETRYSFHRRYNVKESRNFESRRLTRSHSFAGRSKIDSESHTGKSEQQPSQVQKRKVRRNHSVISNTRQEHYPESHRTRPRIQRVLGITQLPHSNVQGLPNVAGYQEPSTSAHQATQSNIADDVIVLDGSEPPPPYYS